jgi:hypothetical protein
MADAVYKIVKGLEETSSCCFLFYLGFLECLLIRIDRHLAEGWVLHLEVAWDIVSRDGVELVPLRLKF